MLATTKALCLLALCLAADGVYSLATPGTPSNPPKYLAAAAQAQKRRNDALNAFMPLPAIDQTTLGNDVRPFLTKTTLLTKEELKIIKSDAPTLVNRMRKRELSSVEVTTAFCKATVIAQNLTNCVTEVLFEEALQRARYLDDFLARTGKVTGPLHGLPISLKDTFVTPSRPSSIGIAAYANEPTTTKSVVVQMMEDLGAISYVKTNVPTAMLMGETINNVWGETINPIHKHLTPGGSSGGEGALLAFRGSPLGIGTDIGGSIRIPGAYGHLYGLKPSLGRLPTWGARPAIQGQDIIYSVSGPMSSSLKSVKLFAESFLSEEAAPWTLDPKMVPIPWRRNVIKPKGRKLKFGLFPCNDGLATCHPPVERALKITVKALKDAGHEVVDWKPIDPEGVQNISAQVFTLTGSDALLPVLQKFDEPLIGVLKLIFPTTGAPPPALTATKLRELVIKRNQLQKDHLDQWMKTGVDGVIAPVAVTTPARLRMDPLKAYGGFSGFGNLMDLPGCSFPVMYADKTLDPKRGPDWVPNSPRDSFIQTDYDADLWDGAPVGLQVLGPRLEEEKVLEMTEVIANAIKFKDRLKSELLFFFHMVEYANSFSRVLTTMTSYLPNPRSISRPFWRLCEAFVLQQADLDDEADGSGSGAEDSANSLHNYLSSSMLSRLPEEDAEPMYFDDPGASFINFKPNESLKITCLTIGSRGDVQPYIALCKGLLADGHQPKIATHREFEAWVRSHGIDFAPVEGDPAELMRICVEHGMFTYSFLREASQKFRGWIDELLSSAWQSCQGSDVLIESPSAMAGIHVAEALRIPYFRAFTMPWTRTKGYPHAFAVPDSKLGGTYNYMSYVMFDNLFWKAIAGQVNTWRKRELMLGDTSLSKMQPSKVPFLYNFSPSVVPPPPDYGEWVRVTGYWFLDEASDWTPPESLVSFLEKAREDNKRIVYIGFGSIVVSDPAALTRTVIQAVLTADVRCVLSKGWSDRLGNPASAKPEVPLPPEIHQITSAPHDWLFTQVDAVAHHGGAGTTGASLRAGVPTIIKPFFGDQFFFGTRVEDLGVGICLRKLNVTNFSKALWDATNSDRMIVKAKLLGEKIRKENGVETAIQALYRDLDYARTLVQRRWAHHLAPSTSSKEGEDHNVEFDLEGIEDTWTFIGHPDREFEFSPQSSHSEGEFDLRASAAAAAGVFQCGPIEEEDDEEDVAR
ncbi:Sterol 3-beta-glucosyltransferase [Ophidiomyces ophidiicola]|nr:Sterol 3-beta-glucosyltransferase [Ophidiomyces ophidiicola]KAI2044187.1 Sterol 3-beta-glucosyltransferase [Ophidiomyces ophidiicola]KAI2047184.1 Sterol 3-beta-glucosyltransferase [Ophidiomyces ophidiicola]KAI2075956.1 Sterol 3-beta-glucosyltransferase [Ophidiomyces ophidiicola]KAI2087720.1 Sterol 3-beta-glucosyltransferase [Ophidiomyces ophidiicola]